MVFVHRTFAHGWTVGDKEQREPVSWRKGIRRVVGRGRRWQHLGKGRRPRLVGKGRRWRLVGKGGGGTWWARCGGGAWWARCGGRGAIGVRSRGKG
jgi:hypothetical protein